MWRWRPPPFIANPWLRLAIYGGAALYLALAFGTLQVNWARVAEGLVRGWAFVAAFGSPDFVSRWDEIYEGMVESLTMTVVSTVLGVALSLPVGLGAARRRVGPSVALQGNLDPAVLFAPPEAIEKEVERIFDDLAATGSLDGHVFNLGHGINQHSPPEHVAALVESVHRISRRLRPLSRP